MSEKKKDLKAFLAKQSKKTKKPATAAEEKTTEEEKKVEHDAEVSQKQDQKTTKDKKPESSDEEEEEDDLQKGLEGFAKIKDVKELRTDKDQTEAEKKGFGLDDKDKPITRAKPDDKKRAMTGGFGATGGGGPGDIVFGGGRPMKFGRGNKNAGAGLAGAFDVGLGDIDDDGEVKKNVKRFTNNSKKSEGLSAADGGREFINFGASAREARGEEEEKREPKKDAVKPTFKGRMKAGGQNADDSNTGVVTSYGFEVSYKKEGEGGPFNKERKPKDKGTPFGQHQKEQNDEDDDFETVKAGREKKVMRKRDDSSDDESGFKRTGGKKDQREETTNFSRKE